MAFDPTTEQRNAIIASSGTLVSAAAGSGKTAVLVERVIRKLCGVKAEDNNGIEEKPIDANRLLIVTFTDAAAKEMRIRIEKRLNEVCRQQPDNNFLVRQKMQLRNAKICTIDSFCIDLVRENFDRLGINPDFSIGDESQLVLFAENALTDIINKNFDDATEEFRALADAVSNDFDEKNLRDCVKEIYDYSQNMPFPEEWIKEQLNKCKDKATIDECFDRVYEISERYIKDAISKLKLGLEGLATVPEVLNVYKPKFDDAITQTELLLDYCAKRNFDEMRLCLAAINWPKLVRVTGVEIGEIPEATSAKALREEAKKLVAELGFFFYDEYDVVRAHSEASVNLTARLLELALEFSALYKQKRVENNIMTFSDTEHLALSLLCEYKEGKVELKDISENIIGRFDEVLVDEFQDTNNMQDMLFSILSDNEKKLFVVGDLKQSIYRFRGANPKNFSEKKDRYVPYDDANNSDLKKIILGNNFRSREGICDFVNFFFDVMMTGQKSILKYETDDHLKYSADFVDNNQIDVEIAFMDADAKDLAADAKNVAEFIQRYMREGLVTDKETKELRKPKYSDFTLLFRSLATKGAKYAMELEKYGIPVSYNLDGYMKTAEIQMIFSLLKVIENPTRDIDLVAIMMSPLFMFSADDLANIRLAKNGSMISAIVAKAGADDQKCVDFLRSLNKFSNFAATSSISELISYIYDETGILNVVSVLENGDARRSNLLMLNSLAMSYESNSSSTNITRFFDHITKLSEKNIKGAGVSAGEDAITLMTIHKSKGLQFPVCIIADTSSTFNSSDYSGRILIDEQLGVSFKQEDEDNGYEVSPLLREIISSSIYDESMAEALRLFYVAMTRAQEKLFISVTTKNVIQKFEANTAQVTTADKWQDYAEGIWYGSSYGDWLIKALLLHESSAAIRTVHGVSGITYSGPGKVDIKLNNVDDLDVDLATESKDADVETDDVLLEQINETLSYKYPYNALKNIESKASVTKVAHKAEKKDYSFLSTPAFLSKQGMTSAQIGTATHRFMQFADLAAAEVNTEKEIERLYEYQFITLKEKEAINIEAVSEFFKSDIYSRMKKASVLEREMRFLTEISAGELNSELDEMLKGEKIVVQGSVDCAFVEDDGIVVLDFKTDRIKNEADLNAAYSEQLNIYAKACEKIFELPVKQKLIYSFALGKEIEL